MEDQPTRRLDESTADSDSGTTRQMEANAPPRWPPHPAWTCPRCQSTTPPIDIYLTAEQRVMAKRQDVLIGWLGGSSSVSARACAACGSIDLYIDDLGWLKS